MGILNAVAEFCSNVGYATIIAAVIAGIFVILGIIYAHHLKKKEPPETIIIPPKSDPLSGLAVNPSGLKDIDKMSVKSKKYSEALATRLTLTKNPDSIADVYYSGGDRDDD